MNGYRELSKAKRTAGILNFTGALAGAWIFFWPEPYKLAAIVAILFPFVAALIMRTYRKWLPSDVQENAIYAKLNLAFLGPALGLVFSALNEFPVLDYDNVWLPSIVLTILLCVMIMLAGDPTSTKKMTGVLNFFIMMIFYLGYGYGAVIALNCGFDESDPYTKKNIVAAKRNSKGKFNTYYISVRHENKFDGTYELKVPGAFYEAVQKGDEVLLDYRKGLLNAPWLNVRSGDGRFSGVPSHR